MSADPIVEEINLTLKEFVILSELVYNAEPKDFPKGLRFKAGDSTYYYEVTKQDIANIYTKLGNTSLKLIAAAKINDNTNKNT